MEKVAGATAFYRERERERERNIQKFNLPNTRGLLARVNSNANFMRTSRKASVRILT